MPASLNRQRRSMKIKRTRDDKGWTLSLDITIYDNGMVSVAQIPINRSPAYDPTDGWAGALEIAVAQINLFRRDIERRRGSMVKGTRSSRKRKAA
jgi:hypothetical protein